MTHDSAPDEPSAENRPTFEYAGGYAGCDLCRLVDSQAPCDESAGKLERDLSRLGEWDYPTIGFVLLDSEREPYQAKSIADFGSRMELIAAVACRQAAVGVWLDRNKNVAGGKGTDGDRGR